MTSLKLPETRSGLLKFLIPTALALLLGGLPLVANAQDSSSSAAAADTASSAAPAAPAAPQPIDPKAVVATVGGQSITEADLGLVANKVGQQQLSQIPQDQLRAVLLTQAITAVLMSEAAKTQQLDQSDDYKHYEQFLIQQALYQAYVSHNVVHGVTDDDIKAEYDKQVAAMPTVDEIHVRHIHVNSEDDAKAIKAQLDGGADFAALAKDKSIDSDAKDSGGDFGYITADKVPKPYADVAFALKINEISQPVQIQAGWYVIQVLDRRPAAKPTLDELSDQIRQQLFAKKFQELLTQLRAAATLTIPDAALKAQVDAQFSGGQ